MYEKSFGIELLRTAARNDGTGRKISEDLRKLKYLFNKNPDYVKILDSPYIPRGELMMILNEEAFLKMDRYMISFLRILSGRHMVHCVDECFKEYEMCCTLKVSKNTGGGFAENFIVLLEEKIGDIQQSL